VSTQSVVLAVGSAHHSQGRVEYDGSSLHRHQLLQGVLVPARLADRKAVHLGDLVGTDHDRLGIAHRDGGGLKKCQSAGQLQRHFARPARLVDVGPMAFEWQPQSIQHLAPIRRARGEYDEVRHASTKIRIGRSVAAHHEADD